MTTNLIKTTEYRVDDVIKLSSIICECKESDLSEKMPWQFVPEYGSDNGNEMLKILLRLIERDPVKRGYYEHMLFVVELDDIPLYITENYHFDLRHILATWRLKIGR